MKKIILGFLFISFACFFAAGTLFAADLYVDNTLPANCTSGNYSIANRDCNGSDGDAYMTIKAAVNAMNGGDDIYIRGGTYYEGTIWIEKEKSGTEIDWSSMQSYPGEWAKIDGRRQCTAYLPSVIGNGNYADYVEGKTFANYWKFERLEITGGGVAGQVKSASGIHWNQGPVIIRYCYIHHNQADDYTGNPGGITGHSTHDAIVEFNYIKNNGALDLDSGGNSRAICFYGSTYYCEKVGGNSSETNWWVHNNEIRYNLVETGGAAGIAIKSNQDLTLTRDGSDLSNVGWGDRIHHNIVLGSRLYGISWQQDFCQIYNNIIYQDASGTDGAAGIQTRQYRSDKYNTLYNVVYNNLIIDSHSSGISDDYELTPPLATEPPNWWVYNNIIDNNTHDWDRDDIMLGAQYNGTIPLINVHIDRNLFYRCESNAESITIGPNRWTIAKFLTATGRSEELWKHSYNAENSLFQGTSGASRFKAISSYALGTGTVASKGIGIPHPYLPSVTIPSYIGAVNPNGVDSGLNWDPENPNHDDAGWVDYVLNLVNISTLAQNNDNPGSGKPPAVTLKKVN